MDEVNPTMASNKSFKLTDSRLMEPKSEDEMTDAEYIGEEGDGEDEEMGEDAIDEEIQEGLTFIDQMIEQHLAKYVRRRSSDLQVLRIKFEGDPIIPPTLTDEQLILFLFAMHYNIGSTVSLLRANYKLRLNLPSLFTSRYVTESRIQEVWDVLKIAVFPKRTNSHQHIVFIGLRNQDSERFKVHSVLKLFLMCADVYHLLEGLPCCIIVVVDGNGASYEYFNRDNYEHLKIVLKYVQEAMPYNVETVHVINTSMTVRALYKFMKPFLTKDIISMIRLHSDNDLQKFLPLRCLPAEFGGTAPGSLDQYQENFRRRFEMLQEFFDMEEDQRAMFYFPEEAES